MTAPASRRRLVWGWLRLGLGICQTILAPAALVLLLTIGLQPVTWVVIALALVPLLASMVLYRSRSSPPSDRGTHS